jgi:hypothetical protein
MFTIHCTVYACPGLEGSTIHVPVPYVVEFNGTGDAHLVVISPDKAYSYEFYQIKQPSGSTINVASGVIFPMNGRGWETSYGGAANAGGSSFALAVVTAQDLLHGAINHALLLTTPCQGNKSYGGTDFAGNPSSGNVYPTHASPDGPCTMYGGTVAGAPMGARMWLDLTDAQIDGLGMPPVKTMVAKALAHYGAFMTDSNGAPSWSIFRQGASGPASAISDWATVKSTLLGGSDTWLSDGWPSAVVNNLKFLDACVTQNTC